MIQMYYCFPFFLGRVHALAYLYTMFRCITKVFVVSEFRGVTDPNLEGIVTKTWFSSSVQNLAISPLIRFMAGFKHLKRCIKSWRASIISSSVGF